MSVETFRALHAADRVLILPNAWDAASASLFVSAGASAIATTSAGLAWSCGYADGSALPGPALLHAVASSAEASGMRVRMMARGPAVSRNSFLRRLRVMDRPPEV